nr:DUF5660 domain-containing protein [bacterium]
MMTTNTPLASPSKRAPSINPFAQAMAEVERENRQSLSTPQADSTSLFRDALSKAGGPSWADSAPNDNFDATSFDQLKQESLRKKELLRQKLHDQVNPVDTHDIFNAREQQVKREIEQIRQELQALASDIEKFHSNIEVSLMGETVSPGQEGIGAKSYFTKLKSWIMLL